EHPKVYHPVTQYVSWASAAALCVRRDVFELVGGFDELLFMYAEDVDISWNIRRFGYQIKYCPKSVVYHYSYSDIEEVKPTQFYYSIYNNLMLRYKYGSLRDIKDGYLLIRSVKKSRDPVFPDQKEKLTELLNDSLSKGLAFRSKKATANKNDFKPKFLGFDYETTRKGAFHVNIPWWSFASLPKVSVIVRTHKRPLVLEQALISLFNQTYPNIEIVVVEDGQNTAQAIIDKYLPKDNIVYHYTGINKGRSHAGNLGMKMATGTYLCFLDDDDLLYADHVESLMGEVQKGAYNMVHAPAFCVPTDVISNDPYIYKELDYETKHDYPVDKDDLLGNNQFPIQAVLFEKRLFDELGGFDETIDYLEDWAMWLKYALDSKIGFVNKLTSLYRVPSNAKQYKTRLSQLLSTRNYVLATYAHNYLSEKIELEHAINDLKKMAPIDSRRVKTHVDLLIYGYNCLSICGWAVVDKKDSFDKIYLKITTIGNTYYFKLAFDKRRDIQRKFNSFNQKMGFKGDLQILGINGEVLPFSLLFVKDGEFLEQTINWKDYHKIKYMAHARRYLHFIR
ncbi:MAG: glycosyltransferase, partial [Bacteroidota bacterium]